MSWFGFFSAPPLRSCVFLVTLCVSSAFLSVSAVGIHLNWDDNFTARDAEKRRGDAEGYLLLSAYSYRQGGSAVGNLSSNLSPRRRRAR